MQKISLYQLRKGRPSRQIGSRQIFVRRCQHHSVKVGDGNFVDQRVIFCCRELRVESFADFKRVPYEVMDFLRSIGSRPVTLLARFHQRVPRLPEHLPPQVIRPRVGRQQQLFEELRRKYSRQNHRHEQHQARHHQCEFCPQPQLHSASLLCFGALAAVFFQLIMKRFQADAEQFRCACLIVSGRAQRL